MMFGGNTIMCTSNKIKNRDVTLNEPFQSDIPIFNDPVASMYNTHDKFYNVLPAEQSELVNSAGKLFKFSETLQETSVTEPFMDDTLAKAYNANDKFYDKMPAEQVLLMEQQQSIANQIPQLDIFERINDDKVIMQRRKGVQVLSNDLPGHVGYIHETFENMVLAENNENITETQNIHMPNPMQEANMNMNMNESSLISGSDVMAVRTEEPLNRDSGRIEDQPATKLHSTTSASVNVNIGSLTTYTQPSHLYEEREHKTDFPIDNSNITNGELVSFNYQETAEETSANNFIARLVAKKSKRYLRLNTPVHIIYNEKPISVNGQDTFNFVFSAVDTDADKLRTNVPLKIHVSNLNNQENMFLNYNNGNFFLSSNAQNVILQKTG